MKKRTPYFIIGLLPFLIVVYLMGPKPEAPVYRTQLPSVAPLSEMAPSLDREESRLPVKPGNAAQIVWAGAPATQTRYVLLYLHGFGACQEEGNPVHRDFARKFGCNLLLSRLYDHGLNEPHPLNRLTPERLWESALQYFAMSRKLGQRVIVMGTSTGGTLALKLASVFPDIYAVILYSPNIALNNPAAFILTAPWGLQMAKILHGGSEIASNNKADFYKKYWYDHYGIGAVVQLQEFTETTMTAQTFESIHQPILLLYYYKDKQHQDPVVKVSAMLDMFGKLGTPADQKEEEAVPDAGTHVICSSLRSKDVASVEKYTFHFAESVLHMTPVADTIK